MHYKVTYWKIYWGI